MEFELCGGEAQTNAGGPRTSHHYKVEARIPMMPDAFKGVLETFLRAAIARNVELAHGA